VIVKYLKENSKNNQLSNAERRYEIFVLRNLTANFFPYLMHGMLSQIAFRLINAPTFVPAYLLTLSGGSNLIVGVALFFQGLGQTLTPLVGANLISHRKRVLPVGLMVGMAMRINIFFIGISGLYLSEEGALIAIIIFLGLFGMSEGMQGVIFNFLSSKILPVSRRGMLMGTRNFLGGTSASIFAFLVGSYFLEGQIGTSGYSLTFIVSFFISVGGLMVLLFLREPEPPDISKKIALLEQLKEIPAILKKEKAYRSFFLARAISTMGKMTLPFYVLYAGQNVSLSGYVLGMLTFVFTLSNTFSNLVWGLIADLYGFRIVFLSSISFWIAGSSVFFFSSSLEAIILVFAVVGGSLSGFEISSRNLILEFGTLKDRPSLIAIANTAAQMAGSLGPLLGGFIATWFGYEKVFLTGTSFLFLGGALVVFFVAEPRKRFNDLPR